MNPTEITAFQITGVGGFVGRYSHGVERVLQFVLPSGEILSIAMTDDQLAAVVSKGIELQAIELETGETMRSIGAYEQG
jgi:hypothetical protein